MVQNTTFGREGELFDVKKWSKLRHGGSLEWLQIAKISPILGQKDTFLLYENE